MKVTLRLQMNTLSLDKLMIIACELFKWTYLKCAFFPGSLDGFAATYVEMYCNSYHSGKILKRKKTPLDDLIKRCSSTGSPSANQVRSSASQFIRSDLQRLERAADQRMGQASHLSASVWEIAAIWSRPAPEECCSCRYISGREAANRPLASESRLDIGRRRKEGVRRWLASGVC